MDADTALVRAVLDAMAERAIPPSRLALLSGLPRRTTYAILAGGQRVNSQQARSLALGLGMSWADLVERAERML